MSLKKILILGKLPPPYMGPSIATEIILKSSLNKHFQLIHLDTKANDSIRTLGKWSLKKIYKNYAIYSKMILKILFKWPDVVLIPISQTTTGFIKDSVFIYIARIFNRKVLLQLRGSDFKNWIDNAPLKVQKYVSTTLKKTQGIIVLGHNLRYLFKPYFPENKIFVVPNGGNYNIPKTIKKNPAKIKILQLANLFTAKGIDDLIDALILINDKLQDKFEIDLVGAWLEEETKERCIKLINENKLPVHIYPSKGAVEKLHYLGGADIFIFVPREPEGHPWVIVEALAAGLPIISTDRGAIVESVLNNVNGFIVPIQNPQAIAEKLILLITDDALRQKMSEESKRLYLAGFTEEKMVERLCSTFNTVIQMN